MIDYMMLLFLLSCTTNPSKPIDTSTDVDTDTQLDSDTEVDTETGETGSTQPPECGNAIVEEGERCDDGNFEDFDDCGFQCTTIHQAQAYTPHDQIITNPERGFYRQKNIIIGQGSPTDITAELRAYRDENMSLVLLMFDLREFVHQDISTAALTEIDNYFNQVRDAGLKAILRFRYTDSYEMAADALPAQTLRHVQQLQPILFSHSDIIFVFQAGFIGVYGEWYSTEHWGEPLAWSAEDTTNRRSLVEAMLGTLDYERTVQLRTPYYRKDLFGDAHACHDGSSEARLGIFNDCFLAPYNDMGTYLDSSDRDWLSEDSACTPVGGETCLPNPPSSECAFALSEMEIYHWSYLNSGYNQEVLASWDTMGCMSQIRRRLGYRLALEDSLLAHKASAGGTIPINMSFKNLGFAAPVNPRAIVLHLQSESTSQLWSLALETDPREWLPQDQAWSIHQTAGLPPDIPAGNYSWLLTLPDPTPTLRNQPDFAIQLANENLWNEEAHWHDLGQRLVIDDEIAGVLYDGEYQFVLQE